MVIKNKLYKGTVELKFESFRHIYTYNGKKVISATQALGIIAKPALINWAANTAIESVRGSIQPGVSYDELELEAIFDAGKKAHYQKKTDAGTMGTLIHKWVEQYIKGENPTMPINAELKSSVEKFLGWAEEHKVKFLSSEQQIYSVKHNYTGTLDFICKVDGKLYLGDLKTSSGIYPEYFMQTAAYRNAREEEFPEEKYEGQMIIHIGRDGDLEIAVVRDDKWYQEMLSAFLSALELTKHAETLKEFKPEKE